MRRAWSSSMGRPEGLIVVLRVARQLCVGTESFRTWATRAEIEAGQRPGLIEVERAVSKALRKHDGKELSPANDMARATASFSRVASTVVSRRGYVHRRPPEWRDRSARGSWGYLMRAHFVSGPKELIRGERGAASCGLSSRNLAPLGVGAGRFLASP